MDLGLYGRTLLRFWYVVLIGAILAVVLATLAYYKVSFTGATPHLKVRATQEYQSQGILFLTEPGFPAGRRTIPLVPTTGTDGQTTLQPKYNDPNRYTSLAPLYARLAESDAVRSLIVSRGGPLRGSYQATPAADNTFGKASQLPMVQIYGFGPTAGIAQATAIRATNGFLAYLSDQQNLTGIPKNQRVEVKVLNRPDGALRITGTKKTLPIVVLIAVLFATLALVFVLENTWPKVRAVASEHALDDVRRSA